MDVLLCTEVGARKNSMCEVRFSDSVSNAAAAACTGCSGGSLVASSAFASVFSVAPSWLALPAAAASAAGGVVPDSGLAPAAAAASAFSAAAA